MANEDNNTTVARDVQATTPEPADRCVVCLDDLSDPCQLVPCGHYNYDIDCIQSWLGRSRRCPLCKGIISQIIRGPRGVAGRPVIELRCPAEILAASLWPSSSTPSTTPRRRRPTPADFAAAAAAAAAATRVVRTTVPPPTTTTTTTTNTTNTNNTQGLDSQSVANHPDLTPTLTPALFRRDPLLRRRARVFLQRELTLFSSVDAEHIGYIVDSTVDMLSTADVASSTVEATLGLYLGARSAHLLMYELKAWLESPYVNLDAWDAVTQNSHQEWAVERRNRFQELEEEYRFFGPWNFMPSNNAYYVPSNNGYSMPSDNGYYIPSDNGYYIPSDNGYYIPLDNGYAMPSDTGFYAPSDSGIMPCDDDFHYIPRSLRSRGSPSLSLFLSPSMEATYGPF